MSEEIRQAIRELAGTAQPRPHSITGKVLEVYEKEMTIDVAPSDGSPELFNVRLRAVLDKKDRGWYWIPKKGSQVVVTLLDAHTGYAAQCAEIEKQVCIIDDARQILEADKFSIKYGDASSFEQTKEGFVFNRGELGGLVKIEQLVKRMHKIEDKLNDLIQKFRLHVHPTTTGPTSPTTTILAEISKTTRSELEDKKVKH